MPKTTTRNKSSKGRRKGAPNPSGNADSVGKYASDAWSLAKRTAIGLNEIRKFINIETKYADATGSGLVDYNGLVTPITQIAQGLDITNRLADSLRIQHITLRSDWTTDATTIWCACRCIVFRDLAQNGSAPLTTDVLQVTGSIHATDSMYNRLNLQRFTILYDETLTVGNVATSQDFNYFDSAHQGHVRYLGTTAAAASNGLGSVYTLFITDRVTTGTPTVTWTTRVAFTDD